MTDTRHQLFGNLAGDSYGTHDDRPPLLLLHGLTYDRRQWGPLLAEPALLGQRLGPPDPGPRSAGARAVAPARLVPRRRACRGSAPCRDRRGS